MRSGKDRPFIEHFPFEARSFPSHAACRFAEKHGLSAHAGPGDAVLPPRVLPFGGEALPKPNGGYGLTGSRVRSSVVSRA